MTTFKPPFPYLNQSIRGTRANRLSMAVPMLARWTRKPEHTHEQALASLVTWMDVENAKRWRPENGATFCDEYSEDFQDRLS